MLNIILYYSTVSIVLIQCYIDGTIPYLLPATMRAGILLAKCRVHPVCRIGSALIGAAETFFGRR